MESYPPESAGSRMITNVPVVHPTKTIGQVRDLLFKKMAELETINYIYVVNSQGRLVGVFSVKLVFQKSEETRVGDIIGRELITVRASTDQERTALLALKHNFKAIPVVDKEGKFLGVVPSDTILEILHSEASEDIFRLAGISRPNLFDNVLKIPLTKSFKQRIPWLLIGLVGGIFAARIIGFFETTLKANLILTAFIPVTIYMADAVGTQMEAFVIRDTALYLKLPFGNYFLRQLLITLSIGIICGGLLFLTGFVLYRRIYLGIVLGIAMFGAILSAVLSGFIIPYSLNKFGADPAIASGPIRTIIQDVSSILIYFGVASWLL